MADGDSLLWVEKYRPKKIEDCILPEPLKKTLSKFVDDGYFPNLLLHSNAPGTGKTSTAKALCESCGMDYKLVNSSLEANVDDLRTSINSFASSLSFSGNRKVVIFDEADSLHKEWTQPALRAFVEKFHKNCGFIFTANYPEKLIEPITSRCSIIDFTPHPDFETQIKKDYLKACFTILNQENITYKKEAVVKVLSLYYPDLRKTIYELEFLSKGGEITLDSLKNVKIDEDLKILFGHMIKKEYDDMRKWVLSCRYTPDAIFSALWRKLHVLMTPETYYGSVMTIAKYQSYHSTVPDRELNLLACLTEIMVNAEWK